MAADGAASQSSFVLYATEDGRTRIQCRFEEETIWLTQALIAELFHKDVRTINEHLVNIYEEGELTREATIRKFRIVRPEGNRSVERELDHYRLEAILAVGYRPKQSRYAVPSVGDGAAQRVPCQRLCARRRAPEEAAGSRRAGLLR